MSVGAFCGLLLTKGAPVPPSLLPLLSSVFSTMDSAGSSGHLPTESELNHCPTLSTRGTRAAGDAALVMVEAQSVLVWGWMGDVTWHLVVACCGVALRYSRSWGGDDKVTFVSLEREAAKDSPDSLRVPEGGGVGMLSQNWFQETSDGHIASMAVGQGQQHCCKQLYLPGAQCFRKYSQALGKPCRTFRENVVENVTILESPRDSSCVSTAAGRGGHTLT